jgi:hypothetical protein
MSNDLPQIISDEEFSRLMEEREKAQRALRPENDRWDNAGVISRGFQPSDGLPESTIEQNFPRIAAKLLVLWPSEACAMYLTSILVNTREARQGFPPQVVEDLMMLHAMNDMILRSGKPVRNAIKTVTAKKPPHC